jgi:hypothetical protein
MESKLKQIIQQLAESRTREEAMHERLRKLESGPHRAPSGSNSNATNEKDPQGSSSAGRRPDPTTDKPRSPNPQGKRSTKEEKGKQPIPSTYSRADDPFVLHEDEKEEFGNQPFLQRDGGLSLLEPSLSTNYKDLARHVHGVCLDPDCVWRKVSGFKRDYAKEVSVFKKTFLCLETLLKTLSAYEELEASGASVSLEDVIYDLHTSTLSAIFTILNHRKFLYSLSTTSEDVAKIFSTIRGYGGELSRDEQESLLFAAKMVREQRKSHSDAQRGTTQRGKSRPNDRERGRGNFSRFSAKRQDSSDGTSKE